MPIDTTGTATASHPAEADLAVGELLVGTGKLGARDLERALAARDTLGGKLADILTQLGLVSESDVVQARAQVLGVPLARAESFGSTPPEVEGLQSGYLASHRVYPFAREGNALLVAMVEPDDAFVLKGLRLATGLEIRPHIGLPSEIDKALADRNGAAGAEDLDGDGEIDSGEFVEHLRDLASEAPVIRLVNTMIGRVIDLRASDIHLEPFEDGLHLRYRVDGELHGPEIIPPRQGAAASSRIKLLAHLDIAERRLPQDGRIRTRVKGRELDLRVSTIPTVHGESVVMRVLDRTSVRLSLEQMGMGPQTLRAFQALLARPHGIVLVTGPTGSGKTTTLYAALEKLDTASQKVITVEDPVEYQLPGVAQTQVLSQIGLTFASALRSILRQDPDIIMIGEMRDGETAQIAVQAALTGHLVLSTLHTNDAAGAVIRLLDMGVANFLITSTVSGVMAQRLVRTLCAACKEPYVPEPAYAASSGLDRHLEAGQPLYRPRGCPECRQTGYRGRAGLFELLVLDEDMRRAIIAGIDGTGLNRMALDAGMQSLHEDGLRKVAAGVTTLEEVLRSTQDAADV